MYIMDAPSFSIIILVCTVQVVKLATINYDDGGTYEYNLDQLGNYNYRLELPEQQRQEEGTVDTSKAEEGEYTVRGRYTFSSKGQLYTVTYIADSNGYRAHIQQGQQDVGSSTIAPEAGSFAAVPPRVGIDKKALESIGGSRSGK